MSDIHTIDYPLVLEQLHISLADRFQALSNEREKLEAPVFALEHNLSEPEVDLVRSAVKASVAAKNHAVIGRDYWLPFIVYSVEVAYGYNGVQYWQGFEEMTPGWRMKDRDQLACWYRLFHDQYRGVESHGPWARWFKNISWPIVNAVLPVDLQGQLAKLLYENRGMAGAVQEPRHLGVRLAARTSGYTSRFQQFCMNTELLGTVASSLLLDKGERSPYLSDLALARIVHSVESERQARIWLGDARAARRKLNARGFIPTPDSTRRGISERTERPPSPALFLQRREGQWDVCVALPDLRVLFGRHPGLPEALEKASVRLLGRKDRLPRGVLLDPGQTATFNQWPEHNQPLLTFERCSDQINNILGDFSLKTPGPWWVFRETGSIKAIEVRGKTLQPGVRYVLLTTSKPKPVLPWVEPVDVRATNISAFRAVVPDQVTDDDETYLREAGLSLISNVIARPVGLVPASWDGQGGIEWIIGEPMMIGISADRTPTLCQVSLDGQSEVLPWPNASELMVVNISGLPIGEHEVAVTLEASDGSAIAQGTLAVFIRDTPTRPEGGAPGEGIRLHIDPARPTLDELWNPSTTLTVDGPVGAEVKLQVELRCEQGGRLLKQPVTRKLTLPFAGQSWRELASGIRKDISGLYDDAETCVLTVSKAGLGFAQVSAARPFRPLSWRIRKAHGRQSATARLVDLTDSGITKLRYYSHSDPMEPVSWPEEERTIPPEGGLVVGESGDFQASVLLPPDINVLRGNAWNDLSRKYIPSGTRSPERLLKFINAYQLWFAAELPGNPVAETMRESVLARIDNAICYLIAGKQWVKYERDDLLGYWRSVTIDTFQDQQFRDAARSIGEHLYEWSNGYLMGDGFTRVTEAIFTRYASDTRSPARFLLHLASRPGVLSAHAPFRDWSDDETRKLLRTVLDKRQLYQLARMAVLGAKATHETGEEA